MSNRLTFSLASLIVLIALGLVFVGTPAKAATFADDAKIADISAIQGAAIDITLPKPTAAGDGDLTASLTDGTTTLSVVDSADPASTEGADGTLFDNLTLSFDDAGNVKLKGNVSPAVVSEVIVTYTIAEADDSSGTPASIENVSLKFAFEVRAQSNLLTFAGADIDNKDDLTVGTYFYEVLPAAQDGIGPLMYSIVNSTETAADSGIFTGGNIPAGMTFAESTRTLSGTPTGAADRAVVVYRVTDSTPTTALTRDIPFTVEVKARVNGPSFAIAKVPDAEYTKGTMKVKQGSEITDSLTLPVADTTNALGSVTYKLEGPDATASDPKLPTGLSFNAATRELSGTPTGDAGDTTLTYTATDTAENAKSINFKITVNAAVSVTAPENVTRILGASPSVDIAIAATLATGGTGTRTLTVDASTLPAGLTFANGKITGDPTAVTATGGSTVTITATDSLGAMKTANFKITVNKAPDITIESADLLKLIADRTYVANTPIQAEVLPKATGGVGDLSYALEGLPTGITFDSATRILRGTPTAASDAAMYTYVVTDDAFGHIDDDARTAAHTKNMLEVQFSITVNSAPATTNNAPDFGTQSIDNIVATANMAIEGVFLPRATDADDDPLTYSIEDENGTATTSPAGLNFSPTTRALTGTPSAKMDETPYTYKVEDDKGGSDTINFFITVKAAANRAPVFSPATPAEIEGTVGVPVVAVVHATDPDGDTLTYSWGVDEAALGLALNTSSGIISGTPLKVHTGTHPVTATDPDGATAMRDVMITIGAAASTPEDPVVAITTTAPTAPQMNSFVIVYTATDPNGDTPTVSVRHTVAPPAAATGYTVDSSTAGMVTIMQAAGSPVAVVTVTITATDDTGRTHSQSISVTFAARGTTPVDTTPPMVVITVAPAPAGPNVHTDTLRVTLNFNEPIQPDTIDIGRAATGVPVLQISDPMVSATDNTIYTVDVLSQGYRARATTSVLLKRGVKDVAGNATLADVIGTYTRPTPASATVTITGPPAALNCEIGDSIRVAVSGTTEKLVAGDITIGAGWKMGTDNDPSDGAFDLVPDGHNALGITSVKVDVKANAVGNNAAVSKTFTVGPELTIPAGGYIVVVRPEHMSSTHLNDPLYLGSLGVRGQPISIQGWDCMPDLTVFFGRTAPGSGGGALVVKQSHAHTGAAIGKGTVGISEIMWASDAGTIHGLTSNTMQAREQWIELHNTNNREVKVTLFARPTNTALVTEGNEIDRMSNYNIGGAWHVKGQNGNSALGTDFVSMYRSKNGNPYSHGDNNGKAEGKWHVSTLTYRTRGSSLAGRGATSPTYNFKGTPGRSNTISPAGPPVKTPVPKSVVFNEVANRRDQTLEWIELKNTTNGPVNLRNYHISFVTGVDSEKPFYTFPNNDNTKIGPGELLLLVDTDPRYNDDHPVAVGRNIHGGNDQALGIGADAPRYMITDFAEGGLPDDGNFILFLRRPDGHDKAGTAANKRGTDKNMIDLAGYTPNLAKQGAPLYTNLWPLKVFGAPNSHNKMEVETVHRRQHVGRDPSQVPDNKAGNAAIGEIGYTGIGYKRHAQNKPAHGGTPGLPHSWTDLGAGTSTAAGHLTISEIMIDQGDGRYPQWIEIYNGSDKPVNLRGGKTGWKLVVYNYDDGDIPIARLSGTLNFRNSQIHMLPPGQTVLIASTRARSSGSAFFDTSVVFPPTRVYSVWDDARGELGQARSTDPILSTEGFYIELIDGGNDAKPNGYLSDAVGNLLPNPGRRIATQNMIEWPLSEITGEMMDGPRSSIMRRYRKPMGRDFRDPRTNAVTWPKYSATELLAMGIMADGWILASKTDFRDVSQTWYGDRDDIGSPGISTGRVLPVELSKFRPERLEDGSVAIRWITESETNNAGFNILRSESRTGEFAKLNTQLIAGQDTTSERTAYEFVDKTAKPNVIYYYQIQDVSLDGDVSTLQVTHLRGHVSAAGKATVTWGEIKALQ